MMNGLNYGVHQGEISESPLMKCAMVVRVVAYGCSADAIDYYFRIGGDSILKAVRIYI